MKHDAPTRLVAVLTDIETANSDINSDVRMSRSDFKLIRSMADICDRQSRIGDALDQIIHEKDQQLQLIRHQLNASQRTVTRLKRRLQMKDASDTEPDTATAPPVKAPDRVATDTLPEVFTAKKTLSTSIQPLSSQPSLPCSDLDAATLLNDEAMNISSCRREYQRHRKTVEQSHSELNVKLEFAKDAGSSGERELPDSSVPETGALRHVTLTREYTDKVVQQNIRLKRILRELIVQRHGSVAEFLVRIAEMEPSE